jgi:hypothetical protein
METQIALEPKYKGRELKDCKYSELKKFAEYLKIDLQSLPKLNENNLRKAIRDAYKIAHAASYKMFVDDFDDTLLPAPGAPIPYDQLRDVSLTFRINYAHHFGASKEEIIQRLKIKPKQYVDMQWHYENTNYKKKVVDYLEARKPQ